MNANYSPLKRVNMIVAVLVITCASAYAATFTAVSSGNWSSSGTWGVTPPSTNVTLDQIIIPAGINVVMDNNVTVSGATGLLNVNGSLTSVTNTMLTISSLGSLSGTGAVTVGGITMNTGANVAFTGTLMADVITSYAASLQIAADMTANESLNLSGGTLSLASGGSFVAGNNSTIVISGGILSLNGGTLGLTGNYNVSYVASSSIAGLELSGSGLNNVTVNVGSGKTVTLTTDLTIDGVLNLESGTLVLNGNDLTIAASGNVLSTGSGSVSANALSDITVNAAAGLGGTLNFAGNGNTVGTLTVNVGAGNSVAMGGSLTVDNTLQLTSGSLNINGASLTIDGTVSGQGTLSGNASSNLSVTTSGGVMGNINFATGGQMLNNLTVNVGQGNSVTIGSALTVNGALALTGGSTLNINGQTLTIGAGGNITGSGSLSANASTNMVINASGGIMAPITINGGTIGGMTINVGAGNTVMLGADLTVDGMLTLQSGTLVLNGNDLTIAASGNVSASGSGSVSANALSDITVNATAGLDGTLNFAGNGNTVGTLTVNVGAGNSVAIGGSLTVDNTLQLTSGSLNINGASLTIDGTVSGQGTLSGNASSNLSVTTSGGVMGNINFATGGQMLNNLTVNVGQGSSVTIGSALTVQGTLDLSGGSTLNINGQTLTIGAGGNISGTGSITANASSTLVINSAGGIMVPVTIGGGTIGGLTVNVGSGNTVTLGADLTVAGSLNLQSGSLVLSGNDLTVTGAIAAGGSGTISSTAASSISINTGTSTSGAISFTSGANTVGNLNVGVGTGGTLQIGSDVTIAGSLNFGSGSIDIDANNLSLSAGATITGAGSTSYIITGTNGTVSMQVTAGGSAAVYPVGTASSYLPANVELNSGSASGEVSVGVNAGVMANGTSGADISVSQPMVDATWFVHSDISANLNLDLTVNWESSLQVNGFNPSAAYISHYHNGSWDVSATSAATSVGGGMYSITKAGITSLSPFAVFDQNTATSVTDVTADLKFSVFPNPATNYIQVRNNHATTDVVDVDVTNAIGQTVATYRMTDTNLEIPVGEFKSGYYFIRFSGKNLNVVKKITKM